MTTPPRHGRITGPPHGDVHVKRSTDFGPLEEHTQRLPTTRVVLNAERTLWYCTQCGEGFPAVPANASATEIAMLDQAHGQCTWQEAP